MVSRDQTYQHKNALLINSIVIFVAIVAAVVTSAVIVTSMVKGEVANAIAKTNQTNSPTYNVAPAAGSCSAPKAKGGSDASVSGLNGSNYSLPSGIKNSFNNTNTSTTNVTKNVKKVEIDKSVNVEDNEGDVIIGDDNEINKVKVEDNNAPVAVTQGDENFSPETEVNVGILGVGKIED